MNDNENLKNLYNTLQKEGYTPPAFEQFAKDMEDDGNLRGVYSTLQNEGYTPPDYDTFRNDMGFGKVAKTNPKVKVGSHAQMVIDEYDRAAEQPMSDTQKAQMLGWARNFGYDIKANTRQSLNRVKYAAEKAKKPLDTKTVRLGENRNVVTKTGFDDTGKPQETHITETGNEYENRARADLEQNQIDEERARRLDPINTELREAYDERDRLNAKMAELGERLDKENDSVLRQMAEAGNATGGLYYNADLLAARDNDQEYLMLHAAANKNDERIRSLEALRDKETMGTFGTIGRALKNTLLTEEAWDGGANDMVNARAMAYSGNIKGDAEKEASQSFMRNYVAANAAAAQEDKDMGDLYRWAKIGGNSAAWAKDFVISGNAMRALTKGGTKLGMKAAERLALNGWKKAAMKNLGIAAGDVAGATALATTLQGQSTAEDVTRRFMGDVDIDKNGELYFKGGDDLGTAIRKGVSNAVVENYTERIGEHIPSLSPLIKKGLGKLGLSTVNQWISKVGASDAYKTMTKWLQRSGFNGFGNEIIEEELNIALNAIFVGDQKFSDYLDPKTQADIIGGMALSMAFMSGGTITAYGVNRGINAAEYKYIKKKLNNADNLASQRLTPEKWGKLKEEIDGTPNDKIPDFIVRIAEDGNMAVQEKEIVGQYVVSLLRMRGHNLKETAQAEEQTVLDNNLTPEEQQNVHEDGMIHTALLYPTAENGGEPQEVFITKGNVVMRGDGTVDTEASSDAIYYKGSDGQVHMTSPDKIQSVNEPVSVEEYAAANAVNEPNMPNEPNTTEGFAVGDEVSVNIGGNNYTATVQGTDGNGNVQVYYQNEDGIDVPATFTIDELRNMNRPNDEQPPIGGAGAVIENAEPNGANEPNASLTAEDIKPIDVSEYFGNAEEAMATAKDIIQNGEVIGTLPDGSVQMQKDGFVATLMPDGNGGMNVTGIERTGNNAPQNIPENGNIGAKNIQQIDGISTENGGISAENIQQEQQIPQDDEGNLIYDQVPVEATIADLYDGSLNDDEVQGFIDANINEAQKKYDSVQKKVPKIGTNKAKYLEQKRKWQADVDEAKRVLDYWNEVNSQKQALTHTTEEETQAAQAELSGQNAREEFSQYNESGVSDAVSVASNFIRGTKITPESFRAETGYGTGEQRRFVGMIALEQNGGKSIDRLAEELVSYDNAELNGVTFNGDTSAAKDAILEALEEIRKGNNPKIKVYRAVPKSVKEGRMRNGDWVTPSRKYAEMHGDNRLEGDYRIIEQEVPANELWWDGNDLNEWGFDDGKGYAYRNTKNNRKLNDLITRDDGGNIIPLSQRFNARKSDVRYNKDRKRSLSAEEAAIRDAVVDRLRESGLEVITDVEEGQRVLDEANGRGERVRTQAMLDGLTKAANTIRSWIKGNKRGRVFTIELPESTQRKIKEAMGRDFDSHNITANGIAHALKNHGVGGNKLNNNSIPLREEDAELIPYIMTAPDYVKKASTDVSGRESVRFYKELSNGYVVVVEKEYKNSPDDMETITMWAETSSEATNARQETVPDTHVQNAILSTDAAKIRKDAETAIENDGKIREHRVYHGSAADFETFDHSHMGEGEGAQAYGWGSYVTEVKGIGMSYATSNEEKRAKLSISEKKEYIKRRKRDINEMGDYERYAKKIMRNRRNSEKEYKAAKKAGNEQDMRFYEDLMAISDSQLKRENHKALIDSFYDDINKAQSEIDELEAKFKGNHHLYTVEIPDDTGENYLDWDKPLPQSLDKGNIAERVFVDVRPDVASDDVELEMLDRDIKDSIDDADTGKKLYKAISLYEGDKAASEVLADFGFTGIKYPADYQRGGREDGAQNYVIFNENDLKITGHVRFFRTADGEAYGFTVGGKIYIDPRVATADTPIHEYAHLWASALRQGNQEEWRNVVGLMKGTPVWEEVKRKYPELTTDDEIADEVLATYSGRRGAERLKEEARKATSGKPVTEAARAETAIGRVREALRKFWQNVADFLHIHYTSAEEVADRVMRDLLEGVNPAEVTINNEKSDGEASNEADTPRMDDIRFSKAEETEGTEPLSASLVDAWDTLAKSFKFQFRETTVDYLTAVEKFQDLVAKHSGKKITEFENAYDWMTFLSSKNRQEMDMFDSLIVTPMNKAIHELTGEKKGLKKWNWDEGPLRDLVMYVEAKHGTDRNRQMAVEEAVKDAENKETLLKGWAETKKRINGQEDVSWTEKQRQLDEAAHGLGADLTEDYSGLSSVFGDKDAYPKGWIQEAVEYVERYENSHDRKHIENLWAAIDNATGFTLLKQQETGLVSREYVERQKERFDNYIPLRGFADEVAGDVYNYIENDFYPGGNPVKTAHGRESEAGNPFGSILNTAYSTISVGNKNLAKQALYSLVMNHDTGGLAVARRAWMVNYEKLMSTPELREIVVTPQLDGDTETPEWVEAVPRIPGNATAEERTRILNDFESVMKRYQKDKAAKPVNKKAKTAYRTLYKERSEHDIPLFIGGNKYIITITGNPRVAQAMNGLLNPDVDNDTLTEMAKKVQRFMSGAFTAKNAAFSIANLTKDTIYANNQVFIRENPKYWLKFTKNQKLGFGAYPQMMRRLKKYNDGKLDMNDKDDRLFKEFMDNGGATGYTFVNTQEEYAKELADKLKELSKKTPKALSVKGLYHIVFDAIEFAGQSAELVNRFAAYKTSREMGRAINRSVRDAKEITVNFNRKGAGRKSADKNKPWYAPINIASALSQYGRTSIIFWNANMQAKYRFYKNLREHPIKTSTTLIANSMAFGAVVMPLLNNMFLPALYEAFGMGGDDDKEDYFNALTDWERTHNLCIRLPKGWWLKIPLSPEMTPWLTMGDAIGGAVSGQRDLSAGDFIKSTIDAVSPLSINWSYEDQYALLNVMPSVSQPLFQNMMNVNFMGSPIKKTPFTREQGYDPEYKMVYSSASPTLVALSRRWNRLVGGEDTKTAGAWLDWNPATMQNIISGYTGGYGTTFLSLADLIVNTANGEEKAVAFSRIPLVSRFAISGNKDVKLKRINSRYDDVRKYIIEFDHDYKAYEDEIDDGIEKKDALRTAEYMRKLDELENSERASLYDDLIEVADSVEDFEDYLKDFPDDEVTRNMLYEIKMRAIDILNGKDKEKNAEKK